MEEGSIAVLVDAKEEYTKQLISVLKPCIYQGIKSIYIDAKDICNQDNTPEKVLMVFQDLLSRIPKWSQDIITKEFERIVKVSACDYIEDLLKVIYVSHIKVLTIVHRAQKNKKLSLKVPNGGHFVHLCYIECAREFWKDPYLFSENANKYELQKNMRDSESMIAECIAETIRKQLPVRHILKEFLNDPDEEIEEAEDDVREPVNKKYMKKLESVVKKELKTTGKSSAATSGGEIDIDLIRKVIREELDTRPQTDVIKKELVETVVEKIVEQAAASTTIETMESVDKAGMKNKPDVALEVESKTPIKDLEPVAKEEKVESKIEQKIEPEPVKKESVAEPAKDNDENIVGIESSNISANNLESLLDELPTRTPAKVSRQDEIVLDSENADSVNKTKADTAVGAEASIKLQINDVDEINLNLDELDGEEITFSETELEEFDIKSNVASNGSKTDPSETKKENTKYIFFE